MSWVIAGVAAAGAINGSLQAKAARDREKRSQMANATAIEMSPWTHVNPGMMENKAGSELTGAMSGGLSGAVTGAMMKSSLADKAPGATPNASGSGTEGNPNFIGPPSSAAMPVPNASGAGTVGNANFMGPPAPDGQSPWTQMSNPNFYSAQYRTPRPMS